MLGREPDRNRTRRQNVLRDDVTGHDVQRPVRTTRPAAGLSFLQEQGAAPTGRAGGRRRRHPGGDDPDGVDAVGVVATWMPPATTTGSAGGRSTLFLKERQASGWAGSSDRALDVVAGDIIPQHVLASCAVPVGFPAQHVPGAGAGWYVDGGVRLNAPLLPAIALGATHIVMISAMSMHYADRDASSRPPHLIDAASQVMHALIADRAVEDLRAVEKSNRLIEQAGDNATLTAADGRPYRTVRVVVVAPEPGELRHLAQHCWQAKYASRSALLRLKDNAVLGRLLRTAGDGASYQELLSYV